MDAVLSEDVDTLMFGSGITIRNWSPEKSGTSPTHVSVYDAVETKNGPSGLDREGMILVALMSGGDYVPEGIPGCGPKTACEAAKAGFGSDLCKIPTSNKRAMAEWRERLQHELKTNESKLFKRKHGTLKIPVDFPRLDILGYYTHPAVSNQTGLDKLKRSIKWDQDLDFPGLRSFTHDAFDWIQLEGAKHFIRSLAPSLVVRQLRLRAEQQERSPTTNLEMLQEQEALIIKGIHGKRQHPMTDNSTELRVSFTPSELVKIDLDKEEPDGEFDTGPPGLQMDPADLDDDPPLEFGEDGPRKRGLTKFDPQAPARIWVLESLVKVGVPLKVQDWEVERQAKLKPKRAALTKESDKSASKAKSAVKKTRARGVAPQATIDQFAKVTKPGMKLSKSPEKTPEEDLELALPKAKAARAAYGDVVSLLSSSPVQNIARASTPQARNEKASFAVLEDLPASVTKRRRAPMQRSRTLPANPSTNLERSAPPSLPDTMETLDLVWSPALPSSLPVPAKKMRAQPFSGGQRVAPLASSPGSSRQTTLDAWRASVTPIKQRDTFPSINVFPMPAPTALLPKTDIIDTLDLTLSSSPPHISPPRTGLTAASRLQKTAPASLVQPPLTSTSSSASRRSTGSRTSTSSAPNHTTKQKDAPKGSLRRTSPRLSKSISLPTEIDTLDLTSLQSQPATLVTTEVDTLDLTGLSPAEHSHWPSTSRTGAVFPPIPIPPSNVRRSTRNHKATSPSSSPAAWKAREKKKRHIILRNSIAGAWDFADIDSPQKTEGHGNAVLKGKERRKWRESEVEVLDFT